MREAAEQLEEILLILSCTLFSGTSHPLSHSLSSQKSKVFTSSGTFRDTQLSNHKITRIPANK